MNPHIIRLLLKGHEEKLKEQDYMAWLQGQYTLSAVSVAVEHCLAGRKAKSQYIKKPILSTVELENKEIAEKDIQMAIIAEEQYIAMTTNKGLPETIIK